MDFGLSDSLQQLTANVRRFVDEEILPVERPVLERGFGAAGLESSGCAAGAGDGPPRAPHAAGMGGGGLALLDLAPVGEVLGRSLIGHYVFNVQAPDAGNMELLLHYGSPEQKERWLRPLVRGEIRSCFGMTEPEFAGSNPVWLGTTARREGDDYVIDGHKWFTSSAEGAAFCVVMAVTNPDAASRTPGRARSWCPRTRRASRSCRTSPVMGERGEGWMSHAEVRLDGVRVPVANRIGDEGAGFALAQERLGPGRIHHCMRWLGICERAFDLMCERAARASSPPASRWAPARSSRPGSPRAAPRSTPPACWCCAPPGASTAKAPPPPATTSR